MKPVGAWLRQLTGVMTQGRYSDGLSERDPAKAAYIRRLQKALKQQDHLHIPFKELPVTVFDLETTGFYPQKGDRILSIGAQKVTGYGLNAYGQFHSFIKSDAAPPEEVSRLTGITEQDLSEAPPAEEVLHDFYTFAGKDTLVAHHASHERQFMQQTNWSVFRTGFDYRVLDTAFLTALITPMENLISLEECCNYYGIDSSGRHHALQDAVMTAELWIECVKDVEKRGFTCLKDVYIYLADKT